MDEAASRARTLTAGKGFALYFVVLFGMLVGGSLLQTLHLQGGLVLSEVLVVLLPALLFWWAYRGDRGWPTLRSPNIGARWWVWIAGTATLLGLSANVVTALIIELVPPFQALASQYEQMVKELLFPGGQLAALGVVAVCVAAPLCEEFLFRGAVLTAQQTARRPLALVLVTNGVLFSLLHVNPFGFVALAVVGAYFAHLTVMTRSLWPAIFAHAVLNTVNGVLLPISLQGTTATEDPALTHILIACIILVPLTWAAWAQGARRLHSSRQDV